MTTPTLLEILQRLREEPEWKKNSGKWSRGLPWIISEHNATRARLLAVCDALEEVLPFAGTTMRLAFNRKQAIDNITNKLAAALKL